ncbi:P-loop containing nucleoside triphosphate hydrolase protein [Apiospora saccharicola]|uniref:Elongation factor 1-alpha n=1 Tax=Apiospora saccharicola TaxID=335842 RepID=A0ABR1U6G1_9PEZI
MSRHQAYRNYDYENDLDEFDGQEAYEEEEELSPEDKAQMEAGTAQVRDALGPQTSKVTTAQIQDALWHYFYDIDKTVAYLVTKHIASPKAAKSAPPQKNKGEVASKTYHESSKHFSFADFFNDMPWGNIPKHREGTFIAPLYPRGGLLGGAGTPGKPSKLQQLALARKKKAEEQKAGNTDQDVQGTITQLSQLSVAQDLGVNEEGKSISITGPSSPDPTPSSKKPGLGTLLADRKRKVADLGQVETPPVTKSSPEPSVKSPDEDPAPEPAAPSAFAQTLLGSAPSAPKPLPKTSYQLPYMAFTSSVSEAFSGPSPDDVVLSAQAKASNKKLASISSKKNGGHDTKINQASEGVKAMNVDDAPLPKSKNLNVLKEYKNSKAKKSVSFIVVGHVDAGKSTLMGRLLLDLNVVDQRTIDKYRKEAESMGKASFALAWVLDQRVEERSRGVTIDIATNRFETDATSFTILDAPGHRDFIPNMIAGASQADFAVLVVDASTGAFEAGLKGQTREHALLIRSMGVSRVIVAVNKLDTVGWSQERFDEISQQVSGFLVATNFQLKNVSFVPVSGLGGDNMVHKSKDSAADWYTGGTLIQELENSQPLARALDKPLRMTISEVFKTTQSPLSVVGRVDAGSLQMGDALLIQPSGEKAYVKSLEVDSEPVDWAVAGQSTVIHLTHIDPIHVRVGDIVCDLKQPISCIDTFTIKALAFDVLMPMQVDVHRGRLHAAGQILEMPAILDKFKGTVLKKKPKVVKAGNIARVVVKLSDKMPLEAGQRIVLRSNGETIAAGLLE